MTALFWIGVTCVCLMVQAFYAMMEMACVSFNRARLQYYVSREDKAAERLHFLLQNPTLLFGTTLIGVNTALQVGSECSRLAYSAMGLNPGLAPITQIFIVLIFAELAPMFAARRYSEHVAMLGLKPLYATTVVMRPVVVAIGWLSTAVGKMVGVKKPEQGSAFTREELQTLIEEQDDAGQAPVEGQEFNRVVASIFALRGKTVETLMEPLDLVPMLPSNATVAMMRQSLNVATQRWVVIYNRERTNIVGVAQPRDVLRIPDHRQVRDFAHAPWFITQSTRAITALQQFRNNKRSVAVVLNKTGSAVGIVTLDDIMEDLFGAAGEKSRPEPKQLIERSFPGEMTIGELNKLFGWQVTADRAETLAELIQEQLGHQPEEGESVRLGSYEFIAKEVALLGTKTVTVRSWLE